MSVPGGSFLMGSDRFYVEERPAHPAEVDPFHIDRCAVSNRAFAAFVNDTHYVTTAETPLDPVEAPDMPDDCLAPGSLVFQMTQGPVPLHDFQQWWRFVPDACWRHPEGPSSTLDGREDHPVVHVSYLDALTYAQWAGKSLPTEKQWEFAARAGSTADYPWGNSILRDGEPMANTWTGDFPWRHDRVKNGVFTVPVDAFEPSRFGTFNMIGNVWEWTSARFHGGHDPVRSCCAPQGPLRLGDTFVLKGGSFLCSASYCERYRPAARSPQDLRTSSNHIGFRCVAH